jgi:hypothetical protein
MDRRPLHYPARHRPCRLEARICPYGRRVLKILPHYLFSLERLTLLRPLYTSRHSFDQASPGRPGCCPQAQASSMCLRARRRGARAAARVSLRARTYEERLPAPVVVHFIKHDVIWECLEQYNCRCTPRHCLGWRVPGHGAWFTESYERPQTEQWKTCISLELSTRTSHPSGRISGRIFRSTPLLSGGL